MNQSSRTRILLGVLVLAAVLSWRYHASKKSAPISSVPQTAASAASPPATSPTPSVSAGSKEEPMESNYILGPNPTPVPKTNEVLCREIQNGRMMIPSTFMFPILRQELTEIVLPAALSTCLTTHFPRQLAFVHFDGQSGLPFRFILEVPVQITRVRTFKSWSDFSTDVTTSAYIKNPKSKISHALKKWPSQNGAEALNVIDFELTQNVWSPNGFGAPSRHPLVPTVTKAQVEALKKEGALLIDVRNPAQFKSPTILDAISIPLEDTAISTDVTSPWDFTRRWLKPYNFEQLPTDKDLVVFHQSQNWGGAYSFATLLHEKGFRRIHYFHGGLDEWNNRPRETPKNSPDLITINALELNSMISSGNVMLVDARGKPSHAKGTIPGAIHLPYIEQKVDESPLLRASNLASLSAQNKENYQAPPAPQPANSQSQAIVFFGNNELDWRPLKAALFARKQGWERVYWFRFGWAQWQFAAKVKNLQTVVPVLPTPTPRPPSIRIAPSVRGRDIMFPYPTPAGK